MKKLGTKPLGALGRIVIPAEVRRVLRVKAGGRVDLYLHGDTLVITRNNPPCSLCGSDGEIWRVAGGRVCKKCRDVILQRLTDDMVNEGNKIKDVLFGEVKNDAIA